MKRLRGLSLVLVLTLGGTAAWGASVPANLSSTYLNTPEWLRQTTVGIDIEQIGRTVSPDGGADVALDVLAYSAFLGYDLSPAVTVFGTIGGTDDSTLDSDDSGSGIKLSAGMNVNLSRYDLRHPTVVDNDRVTVRAVGEVAYYDADSTEWVQATLALPVAYEVVENDRVAAVREGERMVLALFAGPQISVARGEMDTGNDRVDFDEAQAVGLVAGVDLYLAPMVSFGVRVDFFDGDDDELTGGASFRYHF